MQLKKSSLAMLLVFIVGGISSIAAAAEIRGKVRLVEQGEPVRKVSDVVIYFRPDRPPATPADDSAEFVMSTRGKAFDPAVLAVPVGATVEFPNRDPILHNVFSVTGGNAFDAGLIPRGRSGQYTFSEPGRVRVYCNVHQDMVASILVLDTPYIGYPSSNGRFRIRNIEQAGSGTLHVWHERAPATSRRLTLPLDDTLDITLPLTRRQVPTHTNKFGKPYNQRTRRGRY